MKLAGLNVVTVATTDPTVVEFRGADGALVGVVMNLAAINYHKNGRPLSGHPIGSAERQKRYRARKQAKKAQKKDGAK